MLTQIRWDNLFTEVVVSATVGVLVGVHVGVARGTTSSIEESVSVAPTTLVGSGGTAVAVAEADTDGLGVHVLHARRHKVVAGGGSVVVDGAVVVGGSGVVDGLVEGGLVVPRIVGVIRVGAGTEHAVGLRGRIGSARRRLHLGVALDSGVGSGSDDGAALLSHVVGAGFKVAVAVAVVVVSSSHKADSLSVALAFSGGREALRRIKAAIDLSNMFNRVNFCSFKTSFKNILPPYPFLSPAASFYLSSDKSTSSQADLRPRIPCARRTPVNHSRSFFALFPLLPTFTPG